MGTVMNCLNIFRLERLLFCCAFWVKVFLRVSTLDVRSRLDTAVTFAKLLCCATVQVKNKMVTNNVPLSRVAMLSIALRRWLRGRVGRGEQLRCQCHYVPHLTDTPIMRHPTMSLTRNAFDSTKRSQQTKLNRPS